MTDRPYFRRGRLRIFLHRSAQPNDYLIGWGARCIGLSLCWRGILVCSLFAGRRASARLFGSHRFTDGRVAGPRFACAIQAPFVASRVRSRAVSRAGCWWAQPRERIASSIFEPCSGRLNAARNILPSKRTVSKVPGSVCMPLCRSAQRSIRSRLSS
jgi:hypothetical protein